MDAKLLLEGINDLVEKKGISKDDVLTSLKEAIIISSVLAKVSIPMAHSAACLMKLIQLP